MPPPLISVKESVNQIDAADRLFRIAVESYASAVASIDRHVLPLQPGLEPEYRRRLTVIRSAVNDKAGPDALEGTQAQLDHLLAGYCSQTVSLLNERAHDIRHILLALASATGTMEKQSGGYGEQFRQIAQRMDTVRQLVDLTEIRKEISGQVTALNSVAEQMNEASAATIVRLQTEMSAVQHRLDEAEKIAETDPLTGLLNRRGMERRVADLIKHAQPFSIMLLDLNRFKGINDRHGHLCGDEVLTLFAARVASEVRSGDAVCRWGGDEFLALLAVPFREASERSQQIAKKACGGYNLQNGLKLEVSASVGLSQHRPGQSSKEVFAAADSALHGSQAR